MDWRTFVVEFTRALAWPATLLFLIYCFRHKLSEIIARVTRLQYKDTVVEFQRDIAAMQETLESSAQLAKGVDVDKRFNPVLELQNLPPRSAIVEAWLILEAEIDSIYYNHFPDDKKQPFLRKLSKLYKKGLMNDYAFEITNTLRNLRNKAVHEIDFNIPRETLSAYLEVVSKIYDALNPN